MVEEGAEVARGAVGVAALEQQECEAVVSAGEAVVELEGAPVVSDRLVVAPCLGERDGHVLQNARVRRVIAQRETVGRQRRLVIALPLQRQCLVQIIEPLRGKLIAPAPAEQAIPKTHIVRQDTVARRLWQRRSLVVSPGSRGYYPPMVERRKPQPPARDVLEVDWPFFGELCRGLALRIAGSFDPDIVVGIAKAGVIPGVVVASILQRDFASMGVTRPTANVSPTLVTAPPPSVRGRRVLVVDETCDSGDTMKLALSAIKKFEPRAVKSAVSFKTGPYEPDFHALATDSFIILPWDREIIVDGELVMRPDYAAKLRELGK